MALLGERARGVTRRGAEWSSGYDHRTTGPSWLTAAMPSLRCPRTAAHREDHAEPDRCGRAAGHVHQLTVTTDTPFTTVPIDETLTVQQPASWGQLTGTVSGRRPSRLKSYVPLLFVLLLKGA